MDFVSLNDEKVEKEEILEVTSPRSLRGICQLKNDKHTVLDYCYNLRIRTKQIN